MQSEPTALQSAIHEDAPGWVRHTGLFGGPLLAIVAIAWAHPDFGAGTTLGAPAAWTLGVLVLMAVWWMTTAVDMAITALLPVLLFPALGIGTFKESAAGYADNVIFLFGGGAALALALERTHVSGRFANALLLLAGNSPARIVIALFTASVLISAWVSNTATAAMMLPVAIAAVRWADGAAAQTPNRERALRNFGVSAMLAVAYGASIGGAITLIGSPPNLIAADWLDSQGRATDFVSWMKISLPIVGIFGPLAVTALLLLNPTRGLDLSPRADAPALSVVTGKLEASGWITLTVFLLAAAAWIAHPFITALPKGTISDGTIAIGAAALMFIVPTSFRRWRPVLSANALRELPWSVLILFGGGLSLAEAMQRTGLSASIGSSFEGLASLPTPLIVGCVVGTLVFASEIASNTALTATAVPILGALAPALGVPPEKLVIPAAFGASFAFMLPVGTPPNALVYATGRVPVFKMLRTGFALNIIGAVVVTVLTCLLL